MGSGAAKRRRQARLLRARPRTGQILRTAPIRARLAIALAVLGALAAIGSAAPAASAQPPTADPLRFGFNDDWLQHGDKLGLVDQSGADTTRTVISWRVVEPLPDQFSWAAYDDLYSKFAAAGTKPLWVIADAPCWTWTTRSDRCAAKALEPRLPKRRYYEDFAYFAAAIAFRYPDSVAIETWNEPNLGDFWKPRPNPAQAAELAAWANFGVDHVNYHTGSEIPVILGGLAPLTETIPEKREIAYDEFVREAYVAIPGGYWDGVAIHPFPRFKARKEYLDDIVEHLDILREALDDSGVAGTPIWVTEIGLSTSGPFPYSYPKQARGLAAIYSELEAMPDVAAMLVHRLVDGPKKLRTAESGWGVVQRNGTPKPSLCLLAAERGAPCPAAAG